jgi:competence protein ComEA
MEHEMEMHRSKIVIAAVIVVFVFGFILTITRADRSRDLILSIEPIDPSDEITVYVGGAVDKPGLYALPRGSRVSQALDLAGLLDEAETSGIEMARLLHDEESIMVGQRSPTSGADDAVSDRPDSPSPADDLIDINSATEAELQTLPGIGPAIASRIVTYRQQQGMFSSVDELSQINGISDRMVEELRALITAGR